MILHGAGSAKESHFDFARGCRADGIAALAYDARGHGRSEGAFGPGAIDDALAMGELLREHAAAVALRGSSMGGFQAIHAARRADPSLCAVVAICPAPEDLLLRGLRSRGAPASSAATRAPPSRGSSRSTSTRPPPRSGPARRCSCCTPAGTSRSPTRSSEELYAAADEPKRLLVLPGGHHRSLQHDLEMQAESRRFILAAAEGRLAD